MFVTWDPEDGSEPRTWEFDPDDVTRKQAEAIEKAMGGQMQSYESWFGLMRGGNMRARGVLLWHLLRIEHRGLRFEDTPDFRKRQLTIQMSVSELIALRDEMSKMKMEEETKEAFTAQFDRDIREAMERETGVVEGDLAEIESTGKAQAS